MAWTGRAANSVLAVWLTAAAGLCAGLPPAALAQAEASSPQTPPITGRDFAGVRFKQAVVPGKLTFAATKAWSWTDGSARRLELDGNVRVSLAGYQFAARRAAVWMERVPGAEGKDTEQVFVYFDQLGSAAEPAGSVSMSSDQLPVRAVIQVEGGVELRADLLVQAAPPAGASFLETAQGALRRSLRRELGLPNETPPPAPLPHLGAKNQTPLPAPAAQPRGNEPARTAQPAEPAGEQPAQPRPPEPTPAGASTPAPPSPTAPPPSGAGPAATEPSTPPNPEQEPIFSRGGIITVAAGENATFISGAKENAVIVSGGLAAQYQDLKTGRVLQMTAQRGVIFLEPGKIGDMTRFSAESVHAIFLEGEVTATDGTLTVRGPQLCYDLVANKAFMPDAVFWTYDQYRKLPLYVRAKSLRQESARQFTAKDALVTNTAFFDPELAIGASSVTITKQDREVEPDDSDESFVGPPAPPRTETRTIVDARNITVQALGLPIFYWPTYSGDPATFPIKNMRIENRAGSGGAVKATLNAYALLGLKRPGDIVADLLTDFYFERGVGLGTDISWDQKRSQGAVQSYMLPSDRGWDVIKPGYHLNHNGEFRGFFAAEERYRLDEHWTLEGEAYSISDPNFIEGFFQQMAEERREFTNRLMARRIEDNTYFSLQAKANLDDTLYNEYLLESQGYAVNKVPEAYYAREADDLLAESYPGLLTYSSEYRAGRVSMSFDEVTANQRGFVSNFTGQKAFGINANQSIADRLRAEGLFESAVTRFDTRQELSVQTSAGPVHVNPFVVGRATYWDDSFDAYSPEQDSKGRLWSAAGLRLSTTVQRVYETLDSGTLDFHRMRHIIEPNATFWYAGTNVEAKDLPVYDKEVEQLADGGMARFGVTQTFQTQRGGPGQWHSVDLLTLSTDVVLSSNDVPITSPIGRFFDYRPELSNPGNFFVVDGVMRLTDATSLTGDVVYDMDLHQQATHSFGILLRQAPQLVALTDVRYVNATNSTYVNFGGSYQLTDKYSALIGATYDATHGGFQSTVVEFRRRYASAILGFSIAYNDITGQSSFGIVFQPYGAGGEARVSGLGGAGDPTSLTPNTFR